MGVVKECTVNEFEVLPNFDFEKEARGSPQTSTRPSSSNDEKSSVDGEKKSFPNSTQVVQLVDLAVTEVLEELGLRLVEDDYVKWRPDASAHPRNWTATRKFFDTGLVLLLDLFTCVY